MKIAAWQIGPEGPVRAATSNVGLEKNLEDWIEKDPDLVFAGMRMLGRQVQVEAGRLDLLGIDPAGRWTIVEVKAGTLYRDVIAQAMDYAACVRAFEPAHLTGLVQNYLGEHPDPQAAELVASSLRREEGAVNARDVSLIVVGTGRDPGLERIIQFLADGYDLPIRAVTFEVLTLDGAGQVLVREVTEPLTWQVQENTGTQSSGVDSLIARAEANGIGDSFRRVFDAAIQNGLYPRVWKNSLMYAPQANRTRALFTVWVTGDFWTGAEGFADFFQLSEDEVRAALGADGWRKLTPQTADQIAHGLDQLFSTATGRADSQH